MRRSVIAGCVCVLGVWGCESSELAFPTGTSSGDAGRGGENATGGTTRSTTGDGGTGLDATTSSSTASSSNGTGGTGGAGGSSTSAGGTGGAGGSSTSSSSTTSTGWVPVGDGPACSTDADCASLQDPPFARCWTPAQNGNNTCIECIPADHICSSPGNPHPWDCPLEFDNPNPGKCGLTEQTLTTLHYCCQDGA